MSFVDGIWIFLYGVRKIFAETIDPVKSAGLMKKLGMELEGIQRRQTRNLKGEWVNLYLYGVLREAFVERDNVCQKKG